MHVRRPTGPGRASCPCRRSAGAAGRRVLRAGRRDIRPCRTTRLRLARNGCRDEGSDVGEGNGPRAPSRTLGNDRRARASAPVPGLFRGSAAVLEADRECGEEADRGEIFAVFGRPAGRGLLPIPVTAQADHGPRRAPVPIRALVRGSIFARPPGRRARLRSGEAISRSTRCSKVSEPGRPDIDGRSCRPAPCRSATSIPPCRRRRRSFPPRPPAG